MRVRHVKGICGLFAVIIMVSAALPVAEGEAQKSVPREVIRRFNATLLDSMKRADELGYSGRYQLLDPVINDVFALAFMGRQSAGGQWASLSEEEQKLFLKVYTAWTIATYAGRFDSYSGERFEVVSESGPDRGTITVISKLIPSSKEEIAFHYKLRMLEGKWRIVDIHISGVSQLALTRSQFVSIMKSKGFDGLITMLKGKTENFSKGKKE